jgi:hypothetical protein
MEKKFFTFIAGMAVLLGASLFLPGCPTDADDDGYTPRGDPWPTEAITFRITAVDRADASVSIKNEDDTWADPVLLVVKESERHILNAVYEPNKPGAAADDMTLDAEAEPPVTKTAVAYDAALSEAVLKLFTFKADADGTITGIEISGTALPSATGATATNLIVIDVGKPGADNSALPTFKIPERGLGATDGTGEYDYIRLRVNAGAKLVIEADNSAYISKADASGSPCPTGYFNGGCVEVMKGGELRDGAYEGFPLGTEAVILNRFGSSLSVGPEPGSDDATAATVSAVYNKYYAGYLLGNASTEADKQPRIQWDTDEDDEPNEDADYLEVRPGKIAFTASLTAKKNVGLIYSVWFVDDAHLTVDIPDATSGNGLFTNEKASVTDGDYNFYAKQKGADAQTIITIKNGSLFDKRFLTSGAADWNATTHALLAGSDIPITAPASGTPEVKYPDENGTIIGILVPPPS